MLVGILFGCASGGGDDARASPGSAVPVARFDLPGYVDGRGVAVAVTGARTAIAPDALSIAQGAGIGVGMAAFGAASYAVFGPAVTAVGAAGPAGVAAGALGLPLLIWAGIEQSAARDALLRAFEENDPGARLNAALRQELARYPGLRQEAQGAAAATVALRIETLGFVQAPGESAPCFRFIGEVDVLSEDAVVFASPMIWTRSLRSEDMPATRCATLEALARDDARLGRGILTEAYAVIAAAIARRLGFFRP